MKGVIALILLVADYQRINYRHFEEFLRREGLVSRCTFHVNIKYLPEGNPGTMNEALCESIEEKVVRLSRSTIRLDSDPNQRIIVCSDSDSVHDSFPNMLQPPAEDKPRNSVAMGKIELQPFNTTLIGGRVPLVNELAENRRIELKPIPLPVVPAAPKRISSSVFYFRSERVIGSRLTLFGENWEQIVAGTCPIVVNDTLVVTVSVEFLEDEESCQRMETE